MNDALQHWFEQLPGFPGLFATCLLCPGREAVVRSWSPEFAPDAVAGMPRQITDIIEVLQASKLPSVKLRWIFEKSVMYYERRRDGAGLCLITSHEPWIGECESVTDLIEEFRSYAR